MPWRELGRSVRGRAARVLVCHSLFACRRNADRANRCQRINPDLPGDTDLRRYPLALAIVVCGAPALANDGRVEKMLKQLDPDARFEQICDLEAMKHISKDKTYKPERTIVSALEA